MPSGHLNFSSGDVIEVDIDCKHDKLRVRNTTADTQCALPLRAGEKWRFVVGLMKKDDVDMSVRIIDSKTLSDTDCIVT